jgi:RIO kinase 1
MPVRSQAAKTLIEEGLIDTVVRQLMSGKEAMVYVVRCGDETRCAKIYKEANNRSFRQAVDYTENRKVKNSRSARAMAKGSKFGRQEQEAAWQSAEVDALYRLAAAGVRVPQPYNFHDGVLLMELVTDAHGDAAPRLNDVSFHARRRPAHHATWWPRWCACCVRVWCTAICRSSTSCWRTCRRRRRRVWMAPSSSTCPRRWTPQATTTPSACCCATWPTCAIFSASLRPSCWPPQYGPEIWSLYQAAC